MYYSPSTRGFYDADIHDPLPADAVEITADRYAQLLDAQSQGLLIAGDDAGAPIAIAPPGPTPEQALANLRAERDRLLRACDFTQVPDAPLTEAERAVWAAYRQQLRDLPETITDPVAVVWPLAPS